MKAKCEIVNSIDTSFIIGVATDNFTLVTFDSTIKINAPRYTVKYSLDIDNDGHLDFEFCSEQEYSASNINRSKSYIIILNPDIEISVEEITDTGHVCSEVALDYNNTTYTKTTYYNNQSSFSCPETGRDSIRGINKDFYPQVYNLGDTMNSLEKWSNEILTFIYRDNTDLATTTLSWRIIQGLWNNKSDKYLLFRIRKSKNYSYGWVKISIQEYKEIQLHEYAIQQNVLYTIDNRTRLSFYPNPANNQITIKQTTPNHTRSKSTP